MAKRSEVSMTPNVDLSTLAGPELRRLLDATRRRGQAELSYQILQEMASRREDTSARGGLFKGRRSAAPHLVEMNLGADPLERTEEPRPLAAWSRPPDEPAFEPEAEAELEADAEAPLQMPPAQDAPPRRPNRAGAMAGVALSLVAAAALGWSVKGYVDAQRPTPVAAVAAPAPLAARPLETPVFPPAASIPQDAAPAPGAQPEPAPPPEAAAPTPDAEVAAQVTAESAPAPADETPAVAPASAKGCASRAIPAERTICETPGLQRLQRDLHKAYADALQAHQDRALLREHQLAWRDARSDIADPKRLTRLYEQRIRTLNSATADALRQR